MSLSEFASGLIMGALFVCAVVLFEIRDELRKLNSRKEPGK